ncbi:MAG: aldehyde:ferredoxin oxidoreductase [Synergistetes bacterium]|nr:aldehyde:ferredoxin oxidoreductase [Synergistota bacterium]
MLSIDLSTGKSEYKDVSELFSRYIGGTGVLTYLALQELSAELDPLSPEAPIYFGIGPFNGYYPSASKTVGIFKSPLTGNLGESHAGGRLFMAMASSGIHVLKIVGKSPSPVYLSIKDGDVKIVPCSSLWGKTATATERILREIEGTKRGKESILRIGPAGERLSKIACVTVDSSRHFGRHGLGAVMGSKNLKAIVISGSKTNPIPDWGEYNKLYKEMFDILAYSSVSLKYRDLGTASNVIPLSHTHSLPTRNFSQGFFEGAEGISGERFADEYLVKQIACAHCPIGCIHIGQLREMFAEPHLFRTVRISYDYEPIFSLGSNLGVPDAEDVLRLLSYVERQGWDAMSVGLTLAWATEAFQRGIIDTVQTDGIVLSFGDAKTYLRVLENMANGVNEFYRDLEMGTDFCAKKYGGEEFAITFGGVESPGYMTGPSAFVGFAVGVRHSHLDCAGYAVDQELFGKAPDPSLEAEKLYRESLWRMVTNSLVTCLFARGAYTMPLVLRGLKALGIEETEESLMKKARLIHGMKYLLKEKLGFSFDSLKLPEKLTRVYTGRGLILPEDFNLRVRLYREKIEEDIKLLGEG